MRWTTHRNAYLADFLKEHNEEIWNRSNAELHDGLRI